MHHVLIMIILLLLLAQFREESGVEFPYWPIFAQHRNLLFGEHGRDRAPAIRRRHHRYQPFPIKISHTAADVDRAFTLVELHIVHGRPLKINTCEVGSVGPKVPIPTESRHMSLWGPEQSRQSIKRGGVGAPAPDLGQETFDGGCREFHCEFWGMTDNTDVCGYSGRLNLGEMVKNGRVGEGLGAVDLRPRLHQCRRACYVRVHVGDQKLGSPGMFSHTVRSLSSEASADPSHSSSGQLTLAWTILTPASLHLTCHLPSGPLVSRPVTTGYSSRVRDRDTRRLSRSVGIGPRLNGFEL
ncbi:tetratricopeptide repeat-containing protein [Striga asiatica]|uniref:Tetratricopeptide repeat-containing protein n=1 Tax=Striga asiatica TaxID=4170 RepID=A0A5A7QC24_STRAF|nr:tetratricopeptide repeat-containing protein [Striga asiatica]